MSDSSTSGKAWRQREVLAGGVLLAYLVLSWTAPMWLPSQSLPKRPDGSDILLAIIAVTAITGAFHRIMGPSANGDSNGASGLRGELEELRQRSEQQLGELQRQRRNVDQLRTLLCDLVVGSRDREVLCDLASHADTGSAFRVRVSPQVAGDLRRLIDLGLMELRAPFASVGELERESAAGTESIDLTDFVEVTAHGRGFLDRVAGLVAGDDVTSLGPEDMLSD